jgi:hypothetical protein
MILYIVLKTLDGTCNVAPKALSAHLTNHDAHAAIEQRLRAPAPVAKPYCPPDVQSPLRTPRYTISECVLESANGN